MDDWNEADPEPDGGQSKRSKLTVIAVMSAIVLVTIVLCCAGISQFSQLLWMQSSSR